MGARFQWLAGSHYFMANISLRGMTSSGPGQHLGLRRASSWEEGGCLHWQTAFFAFRPEPRWTPAVFQHGPCRRHLPSSVRRNSLSLCRLQILSVSPPRNQNHFRDHQSHQAVHTLPSKRSLFDSTAIISVCVWSPPNRNCEWCESVAGVSAGFRQLVRRCCPISPQFN